MKMPSAETIMLYAIPCFFVLMAVEWIGSRLLRRKIYRLDDAIGSIGLGMISQIVGVFAKVLTIGAYAWVVQRIALFELSADHAWVWLTGLLLYDFCYYWLHRCGHEVGVLWAAHVVHHQSERYNLSTALRQTGSGALLGWLFYLPMALLGYPVEVFAVVAVVDLLYQYWIHTELVPKLGWFDRVFASPSNHRVHHAVNDRYLDKNYGGILILWDRLFGTFVEESDAEPPVFGTRAPLRSWNPLWANAEVYWALAKDAWRARRWRDKLRVWFARPGWRPADVAERFPKAPFDIGRAEYAPAVAKTTLIYCGMQFVILLLLGSAYLRVASLMDGGPSLSNAAFLVLSVTTICGLLEGRRWALIVETARLALFALWPFAASSQWPGFEIVFARFGWLVSLWAALSLIALWWGRQHLSPRTVAAAH